MRKKRSATRFWFAITAMFVVSIAVLVLLRVAFAPWSLSLTGAPTLTGEWIGEMTTASGRRQALWMAIEHPLGGCGNCPSIYGRARVCDAQSGIENYEILGDPENWRGTRFSIKSKQIEKRADGLRLGYMTGIWDVDILRLTTTMIANDGAPGSSIHVAKDATGRETTTRIGGDPDTYAPITFTMERGSGKDFVAACGRAK